MRTRRVAVIVIASVVVLATAYIFWSRYTWNEYETAYTTWHDDVHKQLDEALALPTKTSQQRSAKLTALKDASDTMTAAQDSLCKVADITAWQQSIKPLGERMADCNTTLASAGTVNKSLQEAILYLENEKSFAQIIDSARGDKTELAEGEWEAQAAAWHAALDKMNKATVGDTFVPTKKVALEVIKGIDDAWRSVIAAHQAKDKAAYTKAQTLLVQSYGALGNISDSNEKQLKSILVPLQTQYEASFKK